MGQSMPPFSHPLGSSLQKAAGRSSGVHPRQCWPFATGDFEQGCLDDSRTDPVVLPTPAHPCSWAPVRRVAISGPRGSSHDTPGLTAIFLARMQAARYILDIAKQSDANRIPTRGMGLPGSQGKRKCLMPSSKRVVARACQGNIQRHHLPVTFASLSTENLLLGE